MPLQITWIRQLVSALGQNDQFAAVVRVVFPSIAEILFDPVAHYNGQTLIDGDISSVKQRMIVSS
jgi:hypothetical protein